MGKGAGKKNKKKAKAAVAAPSQGSAKDSQKLAPKEAAMFKQLSKYYDAKQYKKGIKSADAILKVNPIHGETLAMKGLTLNCMKRKDEARDFIKQGLRHNLKSQTCWHVYGLMHRSNRDYDEAIRCYTQALKIDSENKLILKDLALLQIQQRQYEGFAESRRKMLLDKTTERQNWIAYAVGHHLAGNHEQALNILTSFQKTQDTQDNKSHASFYEASELKMYKNQILLESGKVQEALDDLAAIEADVVDKLALRELRVKLCSQLGRKEEALTEIQSLVRYNVENTKYHKQLHECMEVSALSPEERAAALTTLYDDLATEFPKASSVQRFPLDFLPGGPAFQAKAAAYLQNGIRRGIPSLFRDLRSLLTDSAKEEILTSLVSSYVSQLRDHLRFTPEDEECSESPSAIVWALYFLAQLKDLNRLPLEALSAVEEAIKHTPTNIDLYVLKARIYKHAGDPVTAYALMDKARSLDLADRYLNTKCVRYALRADQVTKAQETVTLFLRDGDTLVTLFDMQCMWYELCCGDSWLRQGDMGMALKQYKNVEQHFKDIQDDQFDFHSYCLRKMTLRAYVSMMRWEDTLKSHRFYFRAAGSAVRVYLKLYLRNIAKAEEARDQAEAEALLTPEEQKALKKHKKSTAQQASRKQVKKKKAETVSPEGGKKDDEDPRGEKLAATTDPLGEATKFLRDLELYSPNSVDTWLLSAEVYCHKSKFLLALRALIKAKALAASHPELLRLTVLFFTAFSKAKEVDAAVSASVAEQQAAHFPETGDMGAMLQSADKSLPVALACARAHLLLEPSHHKEALDILQGASLEGAELSVGLEACALARSLSQANAEGFVTSLHAHFPLALQFQTQPGEESAEPKAEVQ